MQSNSERQPDSSLEADRYQVLLELADLMVHHGTLPELFHEMAQTLRKVISFDFIAFSLRDPTFNTMRLHLWEGGETAPVPAQVPVEDSASGWVWQNQLPMIFEDLRQETRFPRTLDMLQERGNRSYCLLPLTTAQKKLGALGFGSSRESAYGTADLQLMERVAELVALAVENALTRQALQEEKERLQALLEVTSPLASHLDLGALSPAVAEHPPHYQA